jgi:AraC-like DNA-binding protein
VENHLLITPDNWRWTHDLAWKDEPPPGADCALADLGHGLVRRNEDAQTALVQRASTLSAYELAVRQAIRLMYQQFDQPLALPEMAEAAVLSPHHFHRVFHRVTGITPGHFLCTIRLKAALQLLLTTQLNVTDICFAVGYNSLGTFTTRFSQLVGLPPTQLRDLVDRAPPLFEQIAAQHEPPVDTKTRQPGLRGRISGLDGEAGPIFVGLFPAAIPQGRPLDCTLLNEPGVYCLPSAPDGSYQVLAAAFPPCAEPLHYLLPDHTNLKIGMSQRPISIHNGQPLTSCADILLRPMRITDPPILTALPLLLVEGKGEVLI